MPWHSSVDTQTVSPVFVSSQLVAPGAVLLASLLRYRSRDANRTYSMTAEAAPWLQWSPAGR